MDVKSRIFELMDARGWTTYELAERAELSQSTVSSLFSMNNVPKLSTIEKICAAFGITLSEFFYEEGKETETEALAHKINSLPDKRKQITKAIIDEFLVK